MPQRARTTALVVLASVLTLVLGYANKARCAGPPFDGSGRSIAFEKLKNVDVCYSDIQYLWIGRDIDHHVFPFIHGGIDAAGNLTGGSVEYPVLSGVLMWLGALGAHTDAAFLLHSAVILALFGLVASWLLGRLAGARALWWALSPALVLFAFHNWDLPAVATVAGAAYVMARGPAALRTRGMIAAVLLALGACLKLYPGLFVLPVVLAVLWGPRASGRDPRRGFDVAGACATAGTAVGTAVAVNLPFAVAGFDGWRASFDFQFQRTADITTNSIWYWGLRPLLGDDAAYDSVVAVASPLLVAAGCLLAATLGWRIARRTGAYPWLQVSGAMLCAFLLLHKVHSPQYVLWLLPLFVLVRVPWPLIAGYLTANTVLGIALFRYFDALGDGFDAARPWEYAVWFGVWGQAALLVAAFACFLRATPSGPRRPAAGPGEPRVGTAADIASETHPT